MSCIERTVTTLQGTPKHHEIAYGITSLAPANNLAWMLATVNETLDVALDLAKAAKAGLPDFADTDDTLGWVYYKKGLWSPAAASFRQAVGPHLHVKRV